jgi:hypothetical protein
LKENDREKAMAIAKDVLAHLHSYQLWRRVYLSGELGYVTTENRDLQEYVPELEASCRMCALGACFVSKARLYDNMPANQFIKPTSSWSANKHGFIELGRENTTQALYDIFTPLQVSMIESAFEMCVMGEEELDTDDDAELLNGAAMYARDEVANNAARVAKVMNNIISHNGVFVVSPITEEDYEPYSGLSFYEEAEDDDADEFVEDDDDEDELEDEDEDDED